MIQPNKIIRTSRRTLSLTISKDGELIVRAPRRLSLDYIFKFIQQKERWIENKQRAVKESMSFNYNIINYNSFLILGKAYDKKELNNIKKIELTNNELVVPKTEERQKQLRMIERFYIKLAEKILFERMEYFASLMKLNYESVKIVRSRSKWGSCDAKGNIKLNYKVVMLKPRVVDYILIHELSHLIEMNHSKEFYRVVETVMPDWREQRLQVKQQNFLLQLF